MGAHTPAAGFTHRGSSILITSVPPTVCVGWTFPEDRRRLRSPRPPPPRLAKPRYPTAKPQPGAPAAATCRRAWRRPGRGGGRPSCLRGTHTREHGAADGDKTFAQAAPAAQASTTRGAEHKPGADPRGLAAADAVAAVTELMLGTAVRARRP